MISDLRKNSSRAINRNKFFSSNSSPGKKRNLETQQVVAVVFVAVDVVMAGGVAVAVVAIPVDACFRCSDFYADIVVVVDAIVVVFIAVVVAIVVNAVDIYAAIVDAIVAGVLFSVC